MRNLLKISVVLLALVVSFSSCKKDKIDRNVTPSMELSQDNAELTELNLEDSELKVYGRVAPDFAGNEVEIKIITNANPGGVVVTAELSDEKTIENGDYLDHYRTFTYKFDISNHNDTDRDLIQITNDETQVKIIVNDGLFEDTYPVNSDDVLIFTYWDINSASLLAYGVDFDGTQNVAVKAWSTRDEQPIDIILEYDDPTQYNGLPIFNHYTCNVPFWNGWSSQPDTTIGIYYDQQDTIFFRYNGKVYFSEHNINTYKPLDEY